MQGRQMLRPRSAAASGQRREEGEDPEVTYKLVHSQILQETRRGERKVQAIVQVPSIVSQTQSVHEGDADTVAGTPAHASGADTPEVAPQSERVTVEAHVPHQPIPSPQPRGRQSPGRSTTPVTGDYEGAGDSDREPVWRPDGPDAVPVLSVPRAPTVATVTVHELIPDDAPGGGPRQRSSQSAADAYDSERPFLTQRSAGVSPNKRRGTPMSRTGSHATLGSRTRSYASMASGSGWDPHDPASDGVQGGTLTARPLETSRPGSGHTAAVGYVPRR